MTVKPTVNMTLLSEPQALNARSPIYIRYSLKYLKIKVDYNDQYIKLITYGSDGGRNSKRY